jgi:hypothetical protein
MANVFIEPRPKGHTEPIEEYVVEDMPIMFCTRPKTQAEATAWARAQGYTPLVALVRHLNDKKKPDHWRTA